MNLHVLSFSINFYETIWNVNVIIGGVKVRGY